VYDSTNAREITVLEGYPLAHHLDELLVTVFPYWVDELPYVFNSVGLPPLYFYIIQFNGGMAGHIFNVPRFGLHKLSSREDFKISGSSKISKRWCLVQIRSLRTGRQFQTVGREERVDKGVL